VLDDMNVIKNIKCFIYFNKYINMSVDPVSGFEYFTPIYGNYPVAVPNVKLGSGAYPTNSWFQNAITNNIDNVNRLGNVTPWYWKVYYSSKKFGLSHSNRTIFINTTTNGNLQQIEQINDDIIVTGAVDGQMFLKKLDDFTATFASENNEFIGYPARGSPYATFFTNGETVNVNFGAFGITQATGYNGGYLITTNSNKITVTNSGFDGGPSSTVKQLTQMSFYNGTEIIPNTNITSTLIYTSGINYNPSTNQGVPPQPSQITVNALGVTTLFKWDNSLNSNGTFTFTPSGSATGIILSDTSILIKYNDNYNLVVNADWNANPQIITATYTIPTTYNWFLTGPQSIQKSGNQLIISGYTGPIQLASSDSDTELNLLVQNQQNYITAGLSNSYNTNGSFTVAFDRKGSNQLMLLPAHWNSFNISGMTKLSVSLQNIIYGDLTYYLISSDNVSLTPKSFVIPSIVNLSSLSTSQRNLLSEYVNYDAKFIAPAQNSGLNTFIPNSDPYAFGQPVLAVGRLFLFAKELGLSLTSGTIADSIQVVRNFLISWLTNTNTSGLSDAGSCDPKPSTIFHLQRERQWGGIIVPCDYLNANNPKCYPLGAFGNSYYNDHHFHWGYMLYALYCLEYVGQGLATTYPKQISALIKDLVNPVSDSFAWKTRHKDWYAGHSWATGIVDSVQRQQESCSEAIGGYYGAYLMAGALNDTTLQSCAAVCLNLEILACQNYYYLQAPGSQLGLMKQVHGAGIILNNSKQFTLDWGMQPDSFNGRALGIYGIQAIPFTDIARVQVNSEWASSIAVGNDITNLSYAITPKLVADLCSDSYSPQPVYDTKWKNSLTFNPDTEGNFWGLVGLKMLSFGNGINNITAQNALGTAKSKQDRFSNPSGVYIYLAKQFDTYSNTLYWLIVNNKYSSAGTSSIIFNSSTISGTTNNVVNTNVVNPNNVVNANNVANAKSITNNNNVNTKCNGNTGCFPPPVPTQEELLANSDLKAQGLVEVPLIRIKGCFDAEQTNVALAYFQIFDEYKYYEDECNNKSEDCKKCNNKTEDCKKCKIGSRDQCLVKGICPEDVEITKLHSKLDVTPTIAATGTNVYDKVNNIGNGVTVSQILAYAYLKLILARIMYGTFNLKYLTQKYNDRFFKDLSRSRFCQFINAFKELNILDYNQYFVKCL
jgi:hypothetical protein